MSDVLVIEKMYYRLIIYFNFIGQILLFCHMYVYIVLYIFWRFSKTLSLVR